MAGAENQKTTHIRITVTQCIGTDVLKLQLPLGWDALDMPASRAPRALEHKHHTRDRGKPEEIVSLDPRRKIAIPTDPLLVAILFYQKEQQEQPLVTLISLYSHTHYRHG